MNTSKFGCIIALILGLVGLSFGASAFGAEDTNQWRIVPPPGTKPIPALVFTPTENRWEERAAIQVSKWPEPLPMTNFVISVNSDGGTNYLLRSSAPFVPTSVSYVRNILADGTQVKYCGVAGTGPFGKCDFEITTQDGELVRVFLSGPSPERDAGHVVDQCLADMVPSGQGNECCSTNCVSEWPLWMEFAKTLPKVEVDLAERGVLNNEFQFVGLVEDKFVLDQRVERKFVLNQRVEQGPGQPAKVQMKIFDARRFLIYPPTNGWFRCLGVGGSYLIPIPPCAEPGAVTQ